MQLKTENKTRVLVVEDDAVVRVYTERVVTKGGYEVVSVPSGEDALKLLEEDHDIDIALTDIMMPGMSGFELLDAIKANSKIAGIRVIMLTALNQVEDKVRAFSCGAADYISKPFESKELLARLGTQTRLKTAEESLRQSEEMFKSLVTHASDAITVTDITGVIVFTNEASLAMMGIDDVEQVIGKDVDEFVSPESQPHMREARKTVIRDGVISNHEFTLLRPDGGLIPVEMTSSVIRDAESKPTQFITITRDITERKEVEKAIRRRLDMEKILSDISTQFMASSGEDVEQKIGEALEAVGRFTGVENCQFFMLQQNGNGIPNVFEWSFENEENEAIVSKEIDIESFPWMKEKLKEREAIYARSFDDLPLEAQIERKLWKQQRIRAVISIPLFYHEELTGVITVKWITKEHVWLDGDTRLLRLVGEVIVNALKRRQGDLSIRHFNERLEGMHEIDHAILSAQSAQTIASSALGHLQKLVPYHTAEVEYINLESADIEMLASQVGDDIQAGESRVSSAGLLELPHGLLKGELHLVNDVRQQQPVYEIEKSLQAQGALAFLIVPLIFHAEFTGVLILAAKEAGVFTAGHLLVVREVADMLALGIKNALLFAEANETVEREMRLDEVTRIISGTLDVDIILKEVVRLSLELVNADASSFCLLSADLNSVASSYHKGLPKDFDTIYHPEAWEITRLSLCDKQSMIINDYVNQEDAIDMLLQEGVRRMMCVPVQASGVQMGVLLMFRKGNAKKFNARDLWIIETVGRQAGAAIQNAMFYQSERHRVQELEAMSDIVADTLGELDLTMLLEAVVVRSVALLDTTGGELGLYNEDTKEITILVSFGLDKNYTDTCLAEGQGVMGHVAASHMPMMVREYQNSSSYCELYQGLKDSAVLAVPLIARKKLLGVLAVADSLKGRVFGPEEMHLLNLFGQQAAIAMENAMLYRSAQQRAIEAETLQQVAAVVASKLNLNEAFPTILEQLGKVIPYDSASVMLIRDGQLETVGGRGFDDLQSVLGTLHPITGDEPLARVLRKGEPLFIRDCQQEYASFRNPPYDQIKSWLGVPLIFQNRSIGMLTLNSYKLNHFSAEHARLVSAFADQVAIAIENAHLYEEARQRAVEAETLRQAGAAVAAQLQSDAAIDSILQQLMKVVPCDNTSVQLVQGDEMVIVGGLSQEGHPASLGMSFSIRGDTPNATVYKTRLPLILEDAIKSYPDFVSHPLGEIHSWLGVPLIIHDQVIGLVALGREQTGYFTQEHARLVSAFADQVGIALENARLFEETQRLATTDTLTELYNRRHFFELSRVELERACRYKRQLSVMMLDIDRFKRINDRYGHLMGDHVLQVIARRIRSSLREIDITGRYGGEEFVALLPETDIDEAHEVAERLRKNIADMPIDIGENHEMVTVSIGVVSLDCKENEVDIERLFDRADQALYHAKQTGRNRVVIWDNAIPQNGHTSGV